MKSGIELIRKERQEQIKKHGWSIERDKQYKNNELLTVAKFCVRSIGRGIGFSDGWPVSWHDYYRKKIMMKDDVGKLIVAGAMYAAENNRIGSRKYIPEIKQIAARIDKLQKEIK